MLKGKTAIVTGGSRGIGAAIVLKLASLGADVAVIYSSRSETANEICDRCITDYGVKAVPYKCNVADYNEVKTVVGTIAKEFGTVNILVNNAGITKDGLVAVMSEKNFDDVIDINLKGAFNMIRHCSSIFMKNRGGKIINITSVSGVIGNAGQANYSASKAGLIGLTKSVAKELAGRNVTCNAIAPGFIKTEMTKDFDESNPFVASIPMKRIGSTEDVAEIAAFLAGSGADYITGEVIRVDGGLAM